MNDRRWADDPIAVHLVENRFWQEQNLFWLRFTAFAALHAGLFALFSTNKTEHVILPSVGFVLSIIWLFVHGFGIFYVHADKIRYWKLCCKKHVKRKKCRKLYWLKPTWSSSVAVLGVIVFWCVQLLSALRC